LSTPSRSKNTAGRRVLSTEISEGVEKNSGGLVEFVTVTFGSFF